MKTRIPAIILLLIFMAVLPFAAAITAKTNNKTSKSSNTAAIEKSKSAAASGTDTDDELICLNLISSIIKDDYCDEALKAIAILVNTNYKARPSEYDEYNNSDTEISDSIKAAYKKAEKQTLLFENTEVYIPYSRCSNGSTYDGDYTYLSPVASPQDCFSEEYSDDIICCGVSLDGINYLCSNGMNAEQALLYYLPKLELA